ncbi:MAG: MmcQ/YjbR family DNA-binding protein [Clostridia bacterium]|nr:MmcQ/YjbR family DNA-binding protein [Clostridia bacterium]
MTTKKEVIDFCLTLDGTYEAYPFNDINFTAMRHEKNDKIFALIFVRFDKVWINLKAEPNLAYMWKEIYPSVVPAYHMNKEHWISVILDGKILDEDVIRLISDSYYLTMPKKKN